MVSLGISGSLFDGFFLVFPGGNTKGKYNSIWASFIQIFRCEKMERFSFRMLVVKVVDHFYSNVISCLDLSYSILLISFISL